MLSGPGLAVLDLGGGFATHNLLLAEDGQPVTVVDAFSAYWGSKRGSDPAMLLALLAEAGVRTIEADLTCWDPVQAFAPASLDVVFTAHALEHFHASPLRLLREAVSRVRAGGRLVIAVPNAVNLRKRIAVLRGRTNLPAFDEFFLQEGPFRGHVREYCVNDLHRLAEVLDVSDVEVYGKNWLGMARAEGMLPPSLLALVDRALQLVPGLCSDLYLVARVRGSEQNARDNSSARSAATLDGADEVAVPALGSGLRPGHPDREKADPRGLAHRGSRHRGRVSGEVAPQ
jgi:SAM-dependent methyltransferase